MISFDTSRINLTLAPSASLIKKPGFTLVLTHRLVQFILCMVLVTAMVPAAWAQHPLHSLVATYVSWGVDEYELFGLTKAELVKKFSDTLCFSPDMTKVCFIGYTRPGFGQPQFLLTYDKGRVIKVKRIFVDGAGCEIIGPLLTSKKDALIFSIDGLSKLAYRTPEHDARLKSAKQMLAELDNPKSAKVAK